MTNRRHLLALVFACALPVQAQPAAEAGWSALKDGSVILFRHANAPGVGDPPAFKLNECSTQRNLDETGRTQARRIGEQFRTRNVKVGAVLTSQWCRTRETAQLAFAGQPKDDADFNSFFGEASQEPTQTARAAAKIKAWRGPGVLVVVTHQVNITALTGEGMASGEAVIVATEGGKLRVVARLMP